MKQFIKTGTTIYAYHIYRNNKSKENNFRLNKKCGVLTVTDKSYKDFEIYRRITINFDDNSFTLLGMHYLNKDSDKYLDGYDVEINKSKGDGVFLLEDSMETALKYIIEHDRERLIKEEKRLETLRDKISIMENLLNNSILSHGEDKYYRGDI